MRPSETVDENSACIAAEHCKDSAGATTGNVGASPATSCTLATSWARCSHEWAARTQAALLRRKDIGRGGNNTAEDVAGTSGGHSLPPEGSWAQLPLHSSPQPTADSAGYNSDANLGIDLAYDVGGTSGGHSLPPEGMWAQLPLHSSPQPTADSAGYNSDANLDFKPLVEEVTQGDIQPPELRKKRKGRRGGHKVREIRLRRLEENEGGAV